MTRTLHPPQWNSGTPLQRFWPQITLVTAAAIGGVWFTFSKSTAMLAVTLLTLFLAVNAIGFAVNTIRANHLRAAVFNWIGGIGGALAMGIISPEFLPIAILCLLEGALCILSLDDSSRRQLRIYSVVTVFTLVILLAITESARSNMFSFGIRLTPVEATVSISGYMLGYGLTFLRHTHSFFKTIHAVVTNLQQMNDELGLIEWKTSQRLQEHAQLVEISRAIGSTQDQKSLMQNTLIQLKPVLEYDRAAVLLLRDGVFKIISEYGKLPDDQYVPTPTINRPQNLTEMLVLQQPLIVSNLSTKEPGFSGSWMGVPLIVRGRLIGLLSIRHMQIGLYTQHDADLCMAFANQVASLIDSAQLQEAASSARVVAERHRLARELHDSVSQSLFGIVLGTRTALEQLEQAPDAARHAIHYSINLADAAFAEMRTLIFALRPETLERKGLIAALQEQIGMLQPHHGMAITLEVPQGEPATSINIKETLYRISTEAVQNAIRHSGCRTLTICLTSTPHSVCIDVVDDGRGFDPNSDYDNHLGLKTMRERAHALSGVLHIDSAPGRGTRITVTLQNSEPDLLS
ncbi:MAG: GAF domain-containing sensor histidine kinase [Chloroflexi bacterium]|nr:GAF domain-containing sensor histidine kinase [Chloroflexota bacterium]